MTAMGHSRHSDCAPITSGLPPISEVSRPGRHFAFVPESDIASMAQYAEGPFEVTSARHSNCQAGVTRIESHAD
jgi:hypothetical protein